MSRAVLDASAVIALLKGERGGASVKKVIADAVIGVVNHAEIVSHFVRIGASEDDIQAMLRALPMTVIAADEALGWEAAAMLSRTSKAGLSLGDRFCLALAKRLGVPAFTADRLWKEIAADCDVSVVVIR